MSPSARKGLVWIALLATVGAAVFAPDEADVVAVTPVASRPNGAPRGATASPVADRDVVLELKPRDDGDLANSTFKSVSWAPPRPVAVARPVAPPPVPAPQAPPLPFRVLGRYMEGNTPSVFMQYNDGTVVATTGAILGTDYRVESISGDTLTLIYLPLSQRQTLSIGTEN